MLTIVNLPKGIMEPAWTGRLWFGSVFGVWCALSAAIVGLSVIKHGGSRFFLGPWFLALFAFALQSFIVAMRTHRPAKKLSLRVSLLTVLGTLPWIVLAFRP